MPTSKHATLDIWDNIYFGLPYLFQESMVLSQLQFANLHYLELSPTVLQNYRITSFVNLWFTPLKYQKVKQQQQQNREINLKKHHWYIYWVSYRLGKIHKPQPFRLFWPPKVYIPINSKFKVLLVRIFSLKQEIIKYFQRL